MRQNRFNLQKMFEDVVMHRVYIYKTRAAVLYSFRCDVAGTVSVLNDFKNDKSNI